MKLFIDSDMLHDFSGVLESIPSIPNGDYWGMCGIAYPSARKQLKKSR